MPDYKHTIKTVYIITGTLVMPKILDITRTGESAYGSLCMSVTVRAHCDLLEQKCHLNKELKQGRHLASWNAHNVLHATI